MLNRKHFAIPYAIFLLSFVVVPLVLIVVYSFTNSEWQLTFKNYQTIFTAANANTLVVSLFIAILTTIVCLIIGYPVAYILADKKVCKSKVMIYFFVMPMWINFVLRSNATKELLQFLGIEASNTTGMYICVLIAMVYDYLPFVHLVLVMTVEPGEGGQKLLPDTIEKIKELKKYINENNLEVDIEVDGGINTENAEIVKQAGANILVSGSAIIKATDYKEVVNKLKE